MDTDDKTTELDMMAQNLANSLQGTLSKAVAQRRQPYDRVGVLVLYWAEDDFFPMSCAEEAGRVIDILRNEYDYEVKSFAIPLQNSRNGLEKAVVDFKFQFDDENQNNLMIVYYSGHADPDEKRGKAVWAAFSSASPEEPRLDWFEIQPTLFFCNSDVLLILDCCYASLATKGQNKGRLEILAATADSSRTPKPGVNSFTHFLVQHLRQAAQNDVGIKTNELHARINQSAHQNPILFNMRMDPKTNILLVPIRATDKLGSDATTGSEQPTLASLTLTVGMRQALSKDVVRELGDWLKANTPKVVSEVKVDELVDLTTGLHEFVVGENTGVVQGRLLDTCETLDRDFIIRKLQDLLAQADRTCGTIASRPFPGQNNEQMKEDVKDLCRSVNTLSRALLSLLADHSKFKSQGALEDLLTKSATVHAGFSWPIKLSLISLDEQVRATPPRLPAGAVKLDKYPTADDIYVMGTYNNNQVLLELVPTNEPESDLERTSLLLSQPIPETLRVPHCVGVTTDPATRRPGLVFDFNTRFERAPTLKMLFDVKDSTPSLEVRFSLAYDIAASLQALHNVRWVHKGVRCCNVAILCEGGATFYKPWLLGFRKSREAVDDSKKWPEYRIEELVYLPKTRWGSPSEEFAYHHDIYALGVVLLEIGLWAPLPRLNKSLKRGNSYEHVLGIMMDLLHKYLDQIMGSSYTSIVEKSLLQGNSEVRMTHTEFDRQIVSVLEGVVQSLGGNSK